MPTYHARNQMGLALFCPGKGIGGTWGGLLVTHIGPYPVHSAELPAAGVEDIGDGAAVLVGNPAERPERLGADALDGLGLEELVLLDD